MPWSNRVGCALFLQVSEQGLRHSCSIGAGFADFLRYWVAMRKRLPIVASKAINFHESVYTIGSRAPAADAVGCNLLLQLQRRCCLTVLPVPF